MITEQLIWDKISNGDEDVFSLLRQKTYTPPSWEKLKKEYYPFLHPVITDPDYKDEYDDETDTWDRKTRITYALQMLATKRMTELTFGIPVQRVYYPQNDRQKELQKYIENIFNRNRIDSVNIERGNMLFASCEVMTLWYAVEQRHNTYGFDSNIKLRCRTFSPMNGDTIYPLFDEYGDLIALSIEYTRTDGDDTNTYFDMYTATRHVKWSNAESKGSEMQIVENEYTSAIGKIPAVYIVRKYPIWEDTSRMVYEMEWSMSRNGNYLRKNSKPVFVVAATEDIPFGQEKSEKKEFRTVLQIPQGATANYVTWSGAIENLKYSIDELREMFFTQLQLPDWSYEKMKSTPMSGEARKQLFIDCQMKVKDESGRILEALDREVNVIKAYLKLMLPSDAADIDALEVENVITPFQINDERETITNIMTATGGKAIMSQREGVELYGHSKDIDKTMEELQAADMSNLFEPTM
ncbi:MAG: phage portal protein [Bacteroidales bacterium]|nr:phage portal protein [Bacteroidales bacterium]